MTAGETAPAAAAVRLGASGDAPAVTIGDRTWSYGELSELIGRVGVAHGTIDATRLPVVDALAAVFAGARAGVPVLLADPGGSRDVPAAVAAPTAAAPGYTPVPSPVRSSVRSSVPPSARTSEPTAVRAAVATAVRAAVPTAVPSAVPTGTFLITVTSGTSGHPRPVLRTAASWAASFAPLARLAGLDSGDRVLLTGPLHATLHLFAAVHTLWLGAQLTDRADRATAVHAVPTVLADLLAAVPAPAALRTAVVAGTALPEELARRAAAGGIAVTEYYGAAELSFVAGARHPDPLRPFPGADVQIRDGEVWVRSPYLAIGYAGDVTGPLRRDADGFATVGDLGEWIDGGGLRIRGRGDAAITTGGATVIAEDVEAALTAVPGVAAAAVVGVPHARLGQVMAAVIEPMAGADLTRIRSAARVILHGPSRPRRWFTAQCLPRTPSGKVSRAAVDEAVRAFLAGDHPSGEQPSDDKRSGDNQSGGTPVLRRLP